MGKTKQKQDRSHYLFSNRELANLIGPLVIEQLLAVFVGMADSIMVANVGEAAVSGVSLVDNIMILIINIFAALATGGAVVAGQYIGRKDEKSACKAATQLVWFVSLSAVAIMILVYFGKDIILNQVFGHITAEVKGHADIYLLIVTASIPFIALYNGGAAIFRAMGNSQVSMRVSLLMNAINVTGNAILVFGLRIGTAGVAIPTLISRMVAAIVITALLCNQTRILHIERTLKIRFDGRMIRKILAIGVPNGLENSMFQLGKLAIQSTVSTLGTTAIAAQAMTNILENLNGMAAIGVGVGLMTIVGQCMGADRKDEAVYYIKKLSVIAEVAIIVSCLLVFALTGPVTVLGGMEPASAKMCFHMVTWITLVKPIVWTLAFVPAYGLRAAGDVKFSMAASCITMWLCRFCLCVILIRFLKFGTMGVWIGMFVDWTVRAVIFTWRFHSRRWLRYKVI